MVESWAVEMVPMWVEKMAVWMVVRKAES